MINAACSSGLRSYNLRLHGHVCLDNLHFKISQGHVILDKVDRGSFSIPGVNHMLVGQDGARGRGRERQKEDRNDYILTRKDRKKRWKRISKKSMEFCMTDKGQFKYAPTLTHASLDLAVYTFWQGLLTKSMGKLPPDL